MTGLKIIGPSRLHFGLLGWGSETPRQFGSVGLMIEDPGVIIEARRSKSWKTVGLLAGRADVITEHVTKVLRAEGKEILPLELTIRKLPNEHSGLGTGTQLNLAIARLLLAHAQEAEPSVARLVALTGRGLRSGIGLHGFLRGGFLVDGGRSPLSAFPPLLARLEFPQDWSILVVTPSASSLFAGGPEREAFARLPDAPARTIDRLCRLILLGLLPATLEHDLAAFGDSLSELQLEVGHLFAPAQGGLFANSKVEALARDMSRLGLVGVGQSSWGPTLYGFIEADREHQEWIIKSLRDEFTLEPATSVWTRASSKGAQLDLALDS